MTTYTHTRQTPRFGHLRSHMRAYLFGAGPTTAPPAGPLVVFPSLATFVAFKGLPCRGGGAGRGRGGGREPWRAAGGGRGGRRGGGGGRPRPGGGGGGPPAPGAHGGRSR